MKVWMLAILVLSAVAKAEPAEFYTAFTAVSKVEVTQRNGEKGLNKGRQFLIQGTGLGGLPLTVSGFEDAAANPFILDQCLENARLLASKQAPQHYINMTGMAVYTLVDPNRPYFVSSFTSTKPNLCQIVHNSLR